MQLNDSNMLIEDESNYSAGEQTPKKRPKLQELNDTINDNSKNQSPKKYTNTK